nr:MAG TPA: hypothetical protein [Caudoviricetes sp.]
MGKAAAYILNIIAQIVQCYHINGHKKSPSYFVSINRALRDDKVHRTV